MNVIDRVESVEKQLSGHLAKVELSLRDMNQDAQLLHLSMKKRHTWCVGLVSDALLASVTELVLMILNAS